MTSANPKRRPGRASQRGRAVLPVLESTSYRQRIHSLMWLRRAVLWVGLPLGIWWLRQPLWLFGLGVTAVIGAKAIGQWEQSLRRQFVRDAQLPSFLVGKLCEQYPTLKARDAELVLYGLRQFFIAHLRSGRKFVAMPSKIADSAWHEFILHTRAYETWCGTAFGRLLHHSPAEVLGRDPRRNDGLRRSWYWACKEESIDPKHPVRLPLLFALDKKFAVAGGFSYVPDCGAIDRQSGSDAHCGTSFGDDAAASGDADDFGGSDSPGDGGCGGDSGCGGD